MNLVGGVSGDEESIAVANAGEDCIPTISVTDLEVADTASLEKETMDTSGLNSVRRQRLLLLEDLLASST